MCGLTGIFDTRGQREIDSDILTRMTNAIRHRGPDGEGTYVAPGIGLGHRRLSIIDIAGGAQPMYNADRSVALVYNGEIYNFPDIKNELERLGYRFRTHCDTEIILHGWEEWGETCVDKFSGMFAFVLWDSRKDTLFLARDRLGKKPLYYSILPNGLMLFGSEIKALRQHPDFPHKIDPHAVEEFFAYGYIPDPRSIYAGVQKLLPAHTLTVRRRGPARLKCYWDLKLNQPRVSDPDEAAHDLIERLTEATRLRLISDVPLGAFLSGGVDSSGIVALMSGLSNEPVNTFSISFGDKAFDESEYAQHIADRYHTNHISREVDPNEFSLIDKLTEVYDEPFGDASALPTYRVCALARTRVTVCLSGDGGDELFAGYRRYLWQQKEAQLRAIFPDALRRPFFTLAGRLYPKLDWAPRMFRAKNTFQELAMDEDLAFFHSVSITSDAVRQRLFSEKLKSELQGYHASELITRHMRAADTDDPLLRAQYADMKTWLPGDILTKVDRASMANSLEVRAPLLDHRLAEWSATLDRNLKLHGTTGKYVLKRALEPFVPNDILYRPKQGFSMPLAIWFRGPLRQKIRSAVNGPALAQTGFFDPQTLDRLVSDHEVGARDHSSILWLLLMFDSFLRAESGQSAQKLLSA